MSSGNPQTPAFQQSTANNRGPVVIVASYIFLVITVIVVFTRLITRFKISRKFAIDDWLILASTVFLIAQTIAITFAVNNGLGRHRDALSAPMFDRYAQSFYTARILAIPTLAFAKSSTDYLIMGIHPPKPVMRACQITLVVINIWAFAGLMAIIFECSPPRVWDFEGRCVNQWALYLSNVVWNVTTDIALVVLPFFLMRNVQVSTQKRWVVIGLFGCRIIVPAFAVAGATAAAGYWAASSPDPTWHVVESTIWMQAVNNLSIIAACIPCIKRFLADLSSGLMTVNISEPLEMTMKNSVSQSSPDTTTNRRSGLFGSKLFSAAKSKSQANRSAVSTMNGSDKQSRPQFVPSQNKRTTRVGKSEGPRNLTDGVIMHTIDYEVNYEQGSVQGTGDGHSERTEDVSGPETQAPACDRIMQVPGSP